MMLTWLMYCDKPQWLLVPAARRADLVAGLSKYLEARGGLAVKVRN